MPTFDSMQVHNALLYVEDLLDRALTPFIVLGHIARSIKKYNDPLLPLDDGGVKIAIHRKNYTRNCRSILEIYLKNKKLTGKEKKIKLEHDGVPIEISIIDTDWKFLQNPDTAYYTVTQFQIPNPFYSYWKVRGLVK